MSGISTPGSIKRGRAGGVVKSDVKKAIRDRGDSDPVVATEVAAESMASARLSGSSDGVVNEPHDRFLTTVFHVGKRSEGVLGPHTSPRASSKEFGFTQEMQVYYAKNGRVFENTLEPSDKLDKTDLVKILPSVWMCEAYFASPLTSNYGTLFVVGKQKIDEAKTKLVFATSRHVVCGDRTDNGVWPSACTSIRIAATKQLFDSDGLKVEITTTNLVFPDSKADFALLCVEYATEDLMDGCEQLPLHFGDAKANENIAVIGYPGEPNADSDDFKASYEINATGMYAPTNCRKTGVAGQPLDKFLKCWKDLFVKYAHGVLSRGVLLDATEGAHDANTTGGMSGAPVVAIDREKFVVIGVHWGVRGSGSFMRNYSVLFHSIPNCEECIKGTHGNRPSVS
jgi:V8-like Glu-specific endopeptidase